jgi:hypothetical protein
MLLFVDNGELGEWTEPNQQVPNFAPHVSAWMTSVDIHDVEWLDKGPDFLWALVFKNDEDAIMFKMRYPDHTFFEDHEFKW